VPIILPKAFPVLDGYMNEPLFFLAGPIKGGGDWQSAMTRLLRLRFGDPIIANPRRYGEKHHLYKQRLEGPEDHFPDNLAWERWFLSQAAESWPSGVVIFWLPAESKDDPRRDGLPFAMDTRGEIGEWRGRLMSNRRLRVVMGADPDFPGLRAVKRNFEEAVPGFKVHDSMSEAVADAARILEQSLK